MIELEIPGARPRTEADMAKVDRLESSLVQREQLMAEVRKHLGMNPKPHEDKVILPDIIDRFNHTRTRQKKPMGRSGITGQNFQEWLADDREEQNPFTAQLHELESLKGNFTEGFELSGKPCTVKRYCSKPCICPRAMPGKHCPLPPGPKHSTFENRKTTILETTRPVKKTEKLRVPEYPLPPSIIDYQHNYFTTIKSRPLVDHFQRSTFSKMQKTVFFKTLMSGFVKDSVCQRKEQHKLDIWALEQISKELDSVKRAFKKFIEKSNEESVTLVKDQLRAGNMREQVYAHLAKKKGAVSHVRADVCRLEGKLYALLLCRDLLLMLSPTPWRLQYKDEADHFKLKFKWLKNLSTLFSNYCRYYPEPGKDHFLDEAMEMLFDEVQTMGPPKIYFTESWQIDMVLRSKELECLNQMADIAGIERNMSDLYQLLKRLTKSTKVEMKALTDQLNLNHAEFGFQKKRAEDLEGFVPKAVNKCVSTLYCADLVLETTALVEELHTDIFGQTRHNPDILQMMLHIERAVWNLEEQKLEMDPKIWKHFEKKITDENNKKRKAALKAKRVYREARNVVRTTHAMMNPPPIRRRTWKLPVRRSSIPVFHHVKPKGSATGCTSRFQHLQVAGILDNEDLENNVHNAIECFIRGIPRSLGGIDDTMRSSTCSDASTESIANVLSSDGESYHRVDRLSDDEGIIDIGYDSEEELIKQNHEKKKMLSKPQVMYDARMLDDRFVIEKEGLKLTEKNRVHSSRKPQQNFKNNSLSWR